MSLPLRRFENSGYLAWAEEKELKASNPLRYIPRSIRIAAVVALIAEIVIATLAVSASDQLQQILTFVGFTLLCVAALCVIAIEFTISRKIDKLRRGETRIPYDDIRFRALCHAMLYDSECKVHKRENFIHPNRRVRTIIKMTVELQRMRAVPFNEQYKPALNFKAWAMQLPKVALIVIDTYLDDPRIIDVESDLKGKINDSAKEKILSTLIETAREYASDIEELENIAKWLKAEALHKKLQERVIEREGSQARDQASIKMNSDYINMKYSN